MRLTSGIAIIVPVLMIAFPGSASSRDLSGLSKNNPFGVTSPASDKPVEPPAQWELRGVIKEPDGYLLNVYDAQTKKSAWIKEGVAGHALLIRSFNRTNGTAVAELAGRSVSLALKSSRQGGSVRTSTTLVATIAAQLQAQTMRVAVAPPESEVRRLQEVAQAVQLLREQRQKALSGNSKS